MIPLSEEWLRLRLEIQNKSVSEVAKEVGTYVLKIQRLCDKYGIFYKTRDEAFADNLKDGKIKYKTGKKLCERTKTRIAAGVKKHHDGLTADGIKNRSETAKKRFEALDSTTREQFKQKGLDGIKRASREGSKLEKLIDSALQKAGYVVEYHKRFVTQNEKLHVDIYLPNEAVAVEIDGPSHFAPVWGEDRFRKTLRADIEKNGHLVFRGNVVVRVCNPEGKNSKAYCNEKIKQLLECLKEVKKKRPPLEESVIMLKDGVRELGSCEYSESNDESISSNSE